jgi:hypothetical protein
LPNLDIDNARAILIADQMDEEGGRRRSTAQQQQLEQQQQAQEERANAEPVRQEMKTVTGRLQLDPASETHLPPVITERSPTATVQANQASEKSDVVFEATAATVQELVLSHQYRYFFDLRTLVQTLPSPRSALEEMAIKSVVSFVSSRLIFDEKQWLLR